MTAHAHPIEAPDVPWSGPHEGGTVCPMTGRRETTLTWRRGPHESIRASTASLRWVAPGWAMDIHDEGDMNAARARALHLGDKARLVALESAWAARKGE